MLQNNFPGIKLFVVAVLLLAAGCFAAGARSSGLRFYDDPIEGRSRGFVVYGDRGGYTAVGATQTRNRFKLETMFVLPGQVGAAVPVGTMVEFRVGDRIVSLNTSREALPVSNVNQSQVFTQWKTQFDLADEAIASLYGGPLSAVRANIGGNDCSISLSETAAAEVQSHLREMSTTVME